MLPTIIAEITGGGAGCVTISQRPQTQSVSMSESRFVELEIRLAYQEDLLQTLNKIVADQQIELVKLNATCLQLHEKLKGLQAAMPERPPLDERPPHY